MRKQLLTFRLLTAVGQLGLLSAGNWLGFAVDKSWVWWVPLVYLLLVVVSHFWLPRHALWAWVHRDYGLALSSVFPLPPY